MVDLTTALLITILAIFLPFAVKIYLRKKRIWDAIEPLGGDKWYPIIGTTLELLRTDRRTFCATYFERNRRNGPFFRSWMGSMPVVHVMKPEHIEPILSSNSELSKGNMYKFMESWLGAGLVTSKGDLWRHHRKLITPTFHFKILDTMMEVFVEKAQELVDCLKDKADGQVFDIFPYLTLCTLDVICESAMGVEINAMKRSDSEYVKALYSVIDTIMKRMFDPVLHSKFMFKRSATGKEHERALKIVHGFTRKVIQERKEKLEKGEHGQEQLSEEDILMGKKKRLAFLDLLLEANRKDENRLTDEQLREEVDTFMFTGHDTTTVTVCWTLFALANHPEIQDKVYEELEGIFQGEDRPVTPQDVVEMNYLDRVIKETLRLFTIVPTIGRNLEKDLVIGGRTIPAGVMIIVHIHELHHDPELYPNPDVFDPDRFLPENSAGRHPYAFIPFSAGPRNCVGQKFAQKNSKVILATLLRQFKVKCNTKVEDMKYYLEIVLRPQDGLNISLEPRVKKN